MNATAYKSPRPTAPSFRKSDVLKGEEKRMYVLTVEMLTMQRIVGDLMLELQNLPAVKAKYRYECSCVNTLIFSMERRVRRVLPADIALRFDAMINGIADELDMQVSHVRTLLRAELVNKISYEKIDSAILVGMIGGLVDAMQQVNERISGRSRTEYTECLRHLRYIEIGIGFEPMNEDTEFDFDGCKAAMLSMFRKLNEIVEKNLNKL